MPAVIPHAMRRPATGPAATFAGIDTKLMGPNVDTNTGATASCAPTVTPKDSRSQSGPRTRSVTLGLIQRIPADAATDNRNAIVLASNGSTSSSPTTASASSRPAVASRPSERAVTANPAMTVARSTDGSNRVIIEKSTRIDTVTAQRAASDRR